MLFPRGVAILMNILGSMQIKFAYIIKAKNNLACTYPLSEAQKLSCPITDAFNMKTKC